MSEPSAAPRSAALAPTTRAERIPHLDVMRGVALFGVLMMNLPWYFTGFWLTVTPEQHWPSRYDHAAMLLTETLLSGKANSLLSFLFGAGFYLLLARLRAREATPGASRWIYWRRMAALLLFGVIHNYLFWVGDILMTYALFGAALPLFARLSQRALATMIVAVMVLVPLVETAYYSTHTPAREAEQRALAERYFAREEVVYSQGSFVEAAALRWDSTHTSYLQPFTWFFNVQILLTMLMGLFAARAGYLAPGGLSRASLKRILALTGGLGIVTAVVYSVSRRYVVLFSPGPADIVGGVAYAIQRPALMVAYAALIMLLVSAAAPSARWLRALQAAGRMPLTVYLSQSFVFTLLSFGYGFSLFGKLTPWLCLPIGVSFYALQLAIAVRWFERFDTGPLERLWRALSYGPAARR